jgi:hypothetical protein
MMSHVHTTLRMGLLIKEFRARVNSPVRVVVGEPIPRAELARYAGDPAMMAFLRETTYALSPTPLDPNARVRVRGSVTATRRRTRRGAGRSEGRPVLRRRETPGKGRDMAVGIFDSGLGGLTVLDAVAKRLPDVPFVYFGDNAHTPYGVRDADDIYDLTTRGVQCLFDEGCDLVILACNTASAAALRRMQEGWVPEDKRVLGVFVPLIEALTERKWGDNSPPREVAV